MPLSWGRKMKGPNSGRWGKGRPQYLTEFETCQTSLLGRYLGAEVGAHGLDQTGVSHLLASLGHSERRVVLGHILNTHTPMKTNKKIS